MRIRRQEGYLLQKIGNTHYLLPYGQKMIRCYEVPEEEQEELKKDIQAFVQELSLIHI